MARNILGGSKSGTAAGALLAGAVSLLALPSAVLAFSTRFDPIEPVVESPANALDEVEAPAGLARAAPFRSLAKGQLFPFTPAGSPERQGRAVTVAVRVDTQSGQAIYVRAPHASRSDDKIGASTPLRIAPTAFNLGVARGYRTFKPGQGVSADGGKTDIRNVEMPDLATFRPGGAPESDPSRFAPRIVIDEKQAYGRSPRTFADDRDDRVDVGGAYRVTRNLDVTAGVRYSQDRERLKPLTDGKQDSQAVYVGTQFRF